MTLKGLKVNKRDLFEFNRAIAARKWISHPDRIIENAIDKITREKNDIKTGHSIKCTLTRCHSDCNK
jgi:hypothetical protein